MPSMAGWASIPTQRTTSWSRYDGRFGVTTTPTRTRQVARPNTPRSSRTVNRRSLRSGSKEGFSNGPLCRSGRCAHERPRAFRRRETLPSEQHFYRFLSGETATRGYSLMPLPMVPKAMTSQILGFMRRPDSGSTDTPPSTLFFADRDESPAPPMIAPSTLNSTSSCSCRLVCTEAMSPFLTTAA